MLTMRLMGKRSAAGLAVLLLGFLAWACPVRAADDAQATARRVLRATGVKGGLVVHVGCGDGRLTAALHAGDAYLVHGLDEDPGDVQQAREYLEARGLYGRVAVAQWDGRGLPYVDNLVNLLVSEQPLDVPRGELMRVLAPRGVACVRENGEWTKTVKPRPGDIDEWTHFLHGPDNNAVSHDARVGPPRHMQWLADPTWCRNHHTLASISGVVSGGGRLFYVVDEAPAASMQIPAQWYVTARDAFNGKLLWKRPIDSWADYRRRFRSGPVQLPRTMVAVDDRLYLPPGLQAPLTAFDAATGRRVKTYPGTERTEEVVVDDGYVLVVTGSPEPEQALKRRQPAKNEKTITAFRARTGEQVWEWTEPDGAPLMPLTLAAAGGRVFFQAGGGVVCLDRDSGEEMWKTDGERGGSRTAGWSRATLVVRDGVVLWADAGRLRALSVKDGGELWSCRCWPTFHSPVDIFVVGDLVWLSPQLISIDSLSPLWQEVAEQMLEGRDLHTGEVKKQKPLRPVPWTAGHHHRCYRDRATERYVMTGKRGVEFIDLNGDDHCRHNWVRGACQYGVMPCNGLLYAPSHCCGCYMEAKLYGFWALSNGDGRNTVPGGRKGPRLERGPAFGEADSSAVAPADGDDWPTYRHDALRSGATGARVPGKLQEGWKTKIGRTLTAPVAAGGRVFAACRDGHRVVALDAGDGSEQWTFTAGGPIDSPPSVHRGLVLFGCRDGWVYCLRASDGEVVWRFRAAPGGRRTLARGNVESVWPVHGSVLVQDGVAYVSAGRSSYLDGGIFLYGLEPATGEVVCRTTARSEHPDFSETMKAREKVDLKRERISQNTVDWKSRTAPDRSDSFSMQGGTISDVLVGDGRSVYLRHMRFGPRLEERPRGRHLFSTSRLLNRAEVHRSHWVLGTGDFSRIPVAYSWIANRRKGRGKLRLARPYGLMLAFAPHTVWGVWRWRGYTLFADESRPFEPDEQPVPDFRESEKRELPEWKWSTRLALRPRAMVRAGEVLLLGGTPDMEHAEEPLEAYRGLRGGLLHVVSAGKGERLAEYELDAPPVWDGMAVAGGRVFMSTKDGRVVCLRPAESGTDGR